MFKELGNFFQDLIDPLLAVMKLQYVGPALAGSITIAGVIIIGFAVMSWRRDLALITRAQQILGQSSEEQFAKRFNTINQDLLVVPKIKEAWAEFGETLIPPQFKDSEFGDEHTVLNLISPCKNTVRPHSFFNLKDMGMGPNFIKVFPSVFVGVGLSLTFLGLIAALNVAVVGINQAGGETKSIQNVIANLLSVSSAKFYASLFALFMSVIMTIVLRLITWNLSNLLGKLNQTIESSVHFLSSEQLSIDANNLLKSQLSQLQTFNADLAMKIGEEIQSSLSKSLDPVIQKLDSMGGDMTEQNIDAIRSISEEVTKNIQGATSGSMDKVAELLDNISIKLGTLSDSLSNALSNFDTEFKEMLEGLKSTLQESTNGIAEGIGESMGQMSEGIGKTATEVSSIIGGLTSSIDSLATTGAEISRQSGEELRKQVEAASKQASEQIALAGKELASGFEETTQEFISAISGATFQLKELEKGILTLPRQLNDVNTELGSSVSRIGEAANQFGAASGGIRELIDPLSEYAANTKQSMTEVNEAIQSASSQMSEAANGINNSINILNEKVTDKLKNLDGADEHLAGLLKAIEESTVRVLTQVNEFTQEVDSGFASSLGLLSETLNEFEEVVDSFRTVPKEPRDG